MDMARWIVAGMMGLCAGVCAGQPGKKAAPPAPPAAQPADPAVRTTVVTNALGFVIGKGAEQSAELDQDAKGRGWLIRDMELKLDTARLAGLQQQIDPKLQINRFAASEDTVVVQVKVGPKQRGDAFNTAMENADRKKPPTLVDGQGRKYEAVGFVYRDAKLTQIRYTKGSPLKGLVDAPTFSRSTPDRELTLLFAVRLGVEVREFRIGETVLETYSPALKCDQVQK